MSNPPIPSDDIILLVTPDETTPIEGQRGWGDDLRKRATSLVEVKIDPQVLERQLTGFLSVVGRVFQQADQQSQSQPGTPPGVQLSEVELSIEISAKGEVKLVAGGEVAGKGAIKLKFTRPEPQTEWQTESVSAKAMPMALTMLTFELDVVTVNAQGQETSLRRGQTQRFTEDMGGGVVLELSAIPGGTFQMGSPDSQGDNVERPQHLVMVKPLLMGKYPVTQAQWQAVAALPKVSRDLEADPSHFKGSKRPVEQVSWHDAVEFCARLAKQTQHDYRLPSEAEWEYACRSGTTTPFHFGATLTTNLANYNGNFTYGAGPTGEYREQTTDVGSFPPNAFGLYGMHGNVQEWCLDHWHQNYQGAPTNGNAWITGGSVDHRPVRGGAWNLTPRVCRSACRPAAYPPDYCSSTIGFRVVCASPWTL